MVLVFSLSLIGQGFVSASGDMTKEQALKEKEACIARIRGKILELKKQIGILESKDQATKVIKFKIMAFKQTVVRYEQVCEQVESATLEEWVRLREEFGFGK
jgi:hypothetical protein